MILNYVSTHIRSTHYSSFTKWTLVTLIPHLSVYLLLRYHALLSIIPAVSNYCNP